MNDRVSNLVLPNGAIRYGIYDAAGALLRYEYIKPEDEPSEVGSPINKATLLTDATAAAYGLTGDNAIPTKAFDLLSFATQYAWTRQKKPFYEIILSAISVRDVVTIPTGTAQVNVNVAATATIDPVTGAITYGGQTTAGVGPIYGGAGNLRGKYWSNAAFSAGGDVYYSSPSAALSSVVAGANTTWRIEGQLVSSSRTVPEIEVLFSTNPNAYPTGQSGEYYYKYFEKFPNLLKAFSKTIITGSYTGNGAVERELNFGFRPSAFFAMANAGSPAQLNTGTIALTLDGSPSGQGTPRLAEITNNGVIVRQSTAGAAPYNALNASGVVYNYWMMR